MGFAHHHEDTSYMSTEGFRLGDLIVIGQEAVMSIAAASIFISLFWSIAYTHVEEQDKCEGLDSYIIRESPMDKERKDKMDAAYSQCIIKQAEGKTHASRRPVH
jgi:hypothetical protein